MAGIKLKWLGHSCFRVEYNKYAVVLDPFAPGSVPGFGDIREEADMVLCSHDHRDHGCREAVRVPETSGDCPFTITSLSSWHDDREGKLRGPNTIYVLEANGIRVAHMGDIGCMPGEAAMEKLKNVDAMLIPVGGHFTVGPQEARAIVEKAEPRVVIPMHYRSAGFGYDVIGPVEDFLKLCDNVVRLDSDTVEISACMPRLTVVPTYGKKA